MVGGKHEGAAADAPPPPGQERHAAGRQADRGSRRTGQERQAGRGAAGNEERPQQQWQRTQQGLGQRPVPEEGGCGALPGRQAGGRRVAPYRLVPLLSQRHIPAISKVQAAAVPLGIGARLEELQETAGGPAGATQAASRGEVGEQGQGMRCVPTSVRQTTERVVERAAGRQAGVVFGSFADLALI